MSVTRLPKDPGPAAWNAILPEESARPSLETRMTADWLVIGAGFAGLSAARRLSQLHPGDRIAVLEARRVAEGPAGRNTGFMIDLPHDLSSDDYGGDIEMDRLQIRMNRRGIDFAAEAAVEYGMPAEALRRSGKINGAATEKGQAHNRDYAGHLSELGEAHEILDAAEMRRITGTEFYEGGLFTPGTAMIQPALYTRNLAAGLVSSRVELYENSPVTDLTCAPDGAWVATTGAGAITAPKVILAVNGHAESFGYFHRRLLHVFTYASMTRALSTAEVERLGGEPTWGIIPADPMGTTVRRISGEGGHRIVVRNRFTYDPGMEVDDRRIEAVARDHDRSFDARFPMLADVEMEYRWGGRLCLSMNGVPAFGEIEPGLYSACCQNGLGTARGTLAGLLAAELASGEESEALSAMQSMADPKRLPPEPFAWIGANATIRYKEWRAGREL